MSLRSFVFVAVAAVGLCGIAQGQSAAVLGKDNAAFARELYRRGYADLALGVSTLLEKTPDVDPAELSQVKLLALDFKLEEAKRETDVTKKKDLVLAVVKGKQEFLKANPTGRDASAVRESLPESLRVLSEVMIAVLKDVKDATVLDLREQGNVQFQDAERQLQDEAATLVDKRDDPAIDVQYMAATYNLSKVQFFHAQMMSTEKQADETRYQKALESFQRFGFDYGDQLLNFEGLIFQGLIHKAQGKKDEAVLDFDDAIRLRETWEPDAAGKYPVSQDAADVISSAVLQKAKLYEEQGQHQQVLETVRDFFATIPDASQTAQALPVMSTELDACVALGDSSGAADIAQKIADEDPAGPWGTRARDLLGKSVGGGARGLGPDKLLAVAQTMMEKGDLDGALGVCSQAVESARGGPDEADWSCEAYLSMGIVLKKRGDNSTFDACAAFDTAADRFPTAKRAPDAIAASMECYQTLAAQEKLSFYKKRFDERIGILVSKYPTHPAAASLQIYEAKQREKEEDFAAAADAYLKATPDSPSYAEAQYKAGSCLFRLGVKLSKAGKAADAKQAFARAEEQLKKSSGVVAAAAKKTLDREMLQKLEKYAFEIPVTLANLYVFPGNGQEAQVIPALAGLEEKYAADADKVAIVWGLRIQALRALGKLEDAEKLLEALIVKSPDSKAIGTAAGVLARALDQRAIELNEKSPAEAAAVWKRALRYYVTGVKSRQKTGGRGDDVEQIAQRLFTMGLTVNKVPEAQTSFVGWHPEKPEEVDREYWKSAAELYEIAQASTASYRTLIGLARSYAYEGQWDPAAAAYGRLFDQERLVDEKTGKFDRDVAKGKPELIFAYLEYGVAEFQVGLSMKDTDRLLRANTIFERLAGAYDSSQEIWWHAKYHQIRGLFERGEFNSADVALRSVERITQDFDQGKYGYKKRFTDLKAELAKKVFPK